MSANPAFRELLLEWAMNIGTPVRPTTFFISFHTADPSTSGANESAELARTQHDLWAVGTADDGIVQNSGAGQTAGATGATTITHFGVWSAVSGGTYYYGGALAGGSEVLALGEKLSWADAALTAAIS